MVADAVLLAAGYGTRITAVTGGIPKPLLPVGEEPVLVRNARRLAAAGVKHLWVNLHYRGDLIRAALGDGSSLGLRIDYSEEPAILGTAGGVRKLLASLGETFLVVYGDNLVELDLRGFVEAPAEVELVKGPNIVSLPEFDALPQSLQIPILLKVGDSISTDEILPAGSRVLPFRSNIPKN